MLATLSLKNTFVKSACLSFSLQTAILKVDIRHIYSKGIIAVIEKHIFSFKFTKELYKSVSRLSVCHFWFSYKGLLRILPNI